MDVEIDNAMHPEMIATRKMGTVCFMDMGYHADCEISRVGQEDFTKQGRIAHFTEHAGNHALG